MSIPKFLFRHDGSLSFVLIGSSQRGKIIRVLSVIVLPVIILDNWELTVLQLIDKVKMTNTSEYFVMYSIVYI